MTVTALINIMVQSMEVIILLLLACVWDISCAAQYFNAAQDTCVLSLVVPKESIKSSCSSNEGLLSKLQAMETQMNQLRRRVHAMDVQRMQPMMVQVNGVESKVRSLENSLKSSIIQNRFMDDKLKSLATKVDTLSDFSERYKQQDNPDRLLDPIKPLLVAEFQILKAKLLKDLEQEMFERYLQNFEEVGSSDDDTTINVEHNSSTDSIHLDKDVTSNPDEKFRHEELFTLETKNLNQLARSLKRVKSPMQKQPLMEIVTNSSPIPIKENITSNSTLNSTEISSLNETSETNYTEQASPTMETDSLIKRKQNVTETETMRKISVQQLAAIVNKAVTMETRSLKKEVDELKEELIPRIKEDLLLNNSIRISSLESGLTQYQENQTSVLQHIIDSQATSEFIMSKNVQDLRSELDRLERRLDSPKNDLLRESKFRQELQRLKANIQSELQRNIERSVAIMRQNLATQERKLNVSNSFINIFKQTLQSYKNESNIITGNLDVRLNKLRNQVQELNISRENGASEDMELRLEDIEAELSDLVMTQGFSDDKIDRMKNTLTQKDREIGAKFREITSSVRRATDRLSQLYQFNRTLSTLQTSYTAVNSKMTKIENTIKYLYIQQKLESRQWFSYNFTYLSVKNSCNKHQYVKKNTHCSKGVGQFVGVVLCSEDRYKIFLGDSLDDDFLDIGDESGHGEDHCEFVGAESEKGVRVNKEFTFFSSTRAYVRAGWGQAPRIDVVSSILTPVTSWYECGVKIPGGIKRTPPNKNLMVL